MNKIRVTSFIFSLFFSSALSVPSAKVEAKPFKGLLTLAAIAITFVSGNDVKGQASLAVIDNYGLSDNQMNITSKIALTKEIVIDVFDDVNSELNGALGNKPLEVQGLTSPPTKAPVPFNLSNVLGTQPPTPVDYDTSNKDDEKKKKRARVTGIVCGSVGGGLLVIYTLTFLCKRGQCGDNCQRRAKKVPKILLPTCWNTIFCAILCCGCSKCPDLCKKCDTMGKCTDCFSCGLCTKFWVCVCSISPTCREFFCFENCYKEGVSSNTGQEIELGVNTN